MGFSGGSSIDKPRLLHWSPCAIISPSGFQPLESRALDNLTS
jgi:hypothetical protein